MKTFKYYFTLCCVAFFLFSCEKLQLPDITEQSASVVNFKEKILVETKPSMVPLPQLLKESESEASSGMSFEKAIRFSVENDPIVIGHKRTLEAKMASVAAVRSRKEFQVLGSVYGGVEDVTDKTRGVAVVLNASRVMFDGGEIDAQIASKGYEADSAYQNIKAGVDKRAFELASTWVELERYRALVGLIEARLGVLDPLISQLDEVAKAGVGDVSRVTAAQRTVSAIRVAQSNVSDGLEQAKVNYINIFGYLPKAESYDAEFVANLIPTDITQEMMYGSPGIVGMYALYQSKEAQLAAVRSKKTFNIDLEAKVSRPFAGSDRDSDESVGLVLRKTIFNGGSLDSEIREAEANVKLAASKLASTYRDGERLINTSLQTVESMDIAIALAKNNVKITADEIVYLRQQLIIGGSTLDSVLSAEARLYEAESNVINFTADKRKSQLKIASALGLLGPALGIDVSK